MGGSGDCFSGDEVLDIISEAVEPKTVYRNEEEEAENETLGNTLRKGGGGAFAIVDALIVEKVRTAVLTESPGRLMKQLCSSSSRDRCTFVPVRHCCPSAVTQSTVNSLELGKYG